MTATSMGRTQPIPASEHQGEPSATMSIECAISSDSPTYTEGSRGQRDPIKEPGCYLCHWNGQLLRICNEELSSGAVELNAEDLNRPPLVTKLSDDPYIKYTRARMIAANWDLTVASWR